MNITDLVVKILKANKLNEEFHLQVKAYVVLTNKYATPIYIREKKDLQKINDTYTDNLAKLIYNSKLIKIEDYSYKFYDSILDEYEVLILDYRKKGNA